MSSFLSSLHVVEDKGGPYVAANVPFCAVQPYLQRLRAMVGYLCYTRLRWNRLMRDGFVHHVTIVAPPEFQRVTLPIRSTSARFETIGLGAVRAGANFAYFVVIDSPEAQTWRQESGLGKKDFHVTLGFLSRDVHDVAKDRTTLIS